MTGLYLHTPFCQRKCSYCDFFSAPPAGTELEDWHRLMEQNLRLIARRESPPLETIFFGGGTPSLLSVEQLDTILTCCREHFPLAAGAEISLEANPATLDPAKLQGYRAAGINRLSLGIQSFDDGMLRLLGRLHSAADAHRAFAAARAANFDSISVDLIFALPGQNLDDLDQQLDQLISLAPDHIGIYGLTIEAGTSLARRVARGEVEQVDDDTYAASYLHLAQRLTAAGFEHYEISNFARPGHRCRHNQGYWRRQPCLAAGAGAHGFNAEGFGSRYAIPEDLDRYRQRLLAKEIPEEILENFDRLGAMSETLYLALRTRDGLDVGAFTESFGTTPQQTFPQAFERIASFLEQRKGSLSLTTEGWLIYDHLISHFL